MTTNGRPRARMRVPALAGVSMETVSRVVTTSEGLRERAGPRARGDRPARLPPQLRRPVGRARVLGVLLQDLGNNFASGLLRALDDASRGPDRPARGQPGRGAGAGAPPGRRPGVAQGGRVGACPRPSTTSTLTPGSGPLPTVFVDRRPHGVETDPALVRAGLRTAEHAEAVVAELMDTGEPPTGVIALRNILSTGSLRALRNAGTTDRVALVGFDDFPTADNESWAERKGAGDWLFAAPKGGPLSEPNWKRSVGWSDAIAKIGRPGCGCTTCGTPAPRCAWARERTRRSSRGSSGTRRRR